MSKIKQSIVIRNDLKVRKGKEFAQLSHAVMAFIRAHSDFKNNTSSYTDVQKFWLENHFPKIVLQIDSEQEMLELYQKVKDAGIEVYLITDSGLTEFHGVPTKTCLAIGPDYAEKIDPFTKHLKLY
jgi:PTH2 family peptidyl-tRNA hydrolase